MFAIDRFEAVRNPLPGILGGIPRGDVTQAGETTSNEQLQPLEDGWCSLTNPISRLDSFPELCVFLFGRPNILFFLFVCMSICLPGKGVVLGVCSMGGAGRGLGGPCVYV